MQEIELKFLVPQARLKGLMRQVKVKSSQTTMMSAHYFDTPKQALAQRGIGLRIRREGDNWVQTIKAGGDGIATRLEHNATLDNELVQAMLETDCLLPDLSLYKDTTIASALAEFKLSKLSKKLTRQYVTDVERTTRLLVDDENENDQSKASYIEVAYDHGQIIHGNDEAQVQDIQEIEFELVSGDVDFLFATAAVWCKRYKLCLSTVTKAERGSLLIKGREHSLAVSANVKSLSYQADISMPAFVRVAVHNCLLQILPNSSAIAAGSKDNEQVLQLRIGIQRLRTVLETFKKFSEQLNPEWLAILKQTATLLGNYHQLVHLATETESKLQQYGAPAVEWTAELNKIKVTPIDAVRANDFQLALLELIAFTMSETTTEPKANKYAIDKLPKILSKQHIKLLKAKHSYENGSYEDGSYEDGNPKDSPETNSLEDSDSKQNKVGVIENNAIADKSDTNEDSKTPQSLEAAELKESADLEESTSFYEHQHKLRKQIKKMRYLSEFAAPLYSKKKTKRWLKRLKKAQDALGEAIDNHHSQEYYQQKSNSNTSANTNAWFGAGWFAAQLEVDTEHCKKRLDNLQDTATFW